MKYVFSFVCNWNGEVHYMTEEGTANMNLSEALVFDNMAKAIRSYRERKEETSFVKITGISEKTLFKARLTRK